MLSLINTLRGMKIDIHRRRPVLASKTGGYSGPGIMPVALRKVYEADIHDDFCVMLPEERQVMLNEMFHSRILQPDGI